MGIYVACALLHSKSYQVVTIFVSQPVDKDDHIAKQFFSPKTESRQDRFQAS